MNKFKHMVGEGWRGESVRWLPPHPCPLPQGEGELFADDYAFGSRTNSGDFLAMPILFHCDRG